MVSEVVLALVAAGEWGLSGLFSKLSSERNGPTVTLLVAQGTGLALVAIAALLLGEGNWDPLVVLPILALGLLNLTGFWALYRAMQQGDLAVVEPLVSTSPALTVLLAVMILRETLPLAAWLAVLGVLLGIVLMALRPAKEGSRLRGRLAPGTAWALWTFFTLGTVTFALKLAVPQAGPIFTIVLLRLGGMVALLPLFMLGGIKYPAGGSTRNALLLPVAVGALDTTGFILFNFAILQGNLTVPTVLSNLYVVVVLLLAWLLLGERLRPYQVAGIGVAVAATVVLVAFLPGT